AATNPYFGPMMGIDDGAIAKTFEVNMKGYLDAARMTAGHLMDRNAKGSIVSIASVAGLGAAPMQGIYGMTKASVISMTQTLAYELGSAGIRVNAIAPGLIKTKFAGALVDDEDTKNRILGRTPLGRIGEPQDIAGAALFLASDAAAYVTGHVLVADGGLTLATI
ncbi:MAG: SDR family oxidoreductase, partial [Deltaproteobacteria bacterium]|nr:SDR family oxidoreductase [Deltaproteobacteria bacterium]